MTDQLWQIASLEGKGKGLLATQEIPAGATILSVPDPYVAILNNAQLKRCCTECLSDSKPLSACAGCKTVRFCSVDCQTRSWHRDHKSMCKKFKQIAKDGRELPTTTRAACALLERISKIDSSPSSPSAVMDGRRLAYDQLMTHEADYRNGHPAGHNIEVETRMVMFLRGLGSNDGTTERKAVSKLNVNTFLLTNPESEEDIGLLFDPYLALANHSCVPNAYINASGRMAEIRSSRSIAVGEEICVSYIDTIQPLSHRQEATWNRFCFKCACMRCRFNMSVYGVFCSQADQQRLDQDKARYIWDSQNMLSFAAEEVPLPDVSYLKTVTSASMETPADVKNVMRRLLKSSNLLSHRRIAIYPFSDIVEKLYEYNLTTETYGTATIILCGKLANIIPYQHPEPNHPSKVAHYLALSRLLKIAFTQPGPEGIMTVAAETGCSEIMQELGVHLFETELALLALACHYVFQSHGPDSSFTRTLKRSTNELVGEYVSQNPLGLSRTELDRKISNLMELDDFLVGPLLARVGKIGQLEVLLKALLR